MAKRFTELFIIQPKEGTNMVTNPSFELGTTGYTAVGASSSIAQVATQQRRGTYALDITPTSNAASGVYFGTVSLVSGTTYTFSCDVKDVVGQSFSIYIQAADGSPTSGSTAWTGDGYWKRKAVTWACSSSETYRLYLSRASVASTTHFYTDGWQCESGAESTYFDGDSRGFNRFRSDYIWNGTPHASTSYRSGKTRSGGTLLRVRDYVTIAQILGMGMPPVDNQALPSSGGGAFYQKTRKNEREITLILNFSVPSGLSTIHSNRAAITEAIKPDNVPTDEPMVLRWYLEDENGVQASEVLDLHCLYSGGLEYDSGAPDGSQVFNQAVVTFTAFDPLFKADGYGGADLSFTQDVADAAYLIYRSTSGTWTSAGSVNGAIYAIVQGRDGNIYAAGNFTSIGGVSANRIAYWNGSAWNAMGSGLNAACYALAVSPEGYIYAGGAFAAPGGGTFNKMGVWNGSSWSDIGPVGTGFSDTVYALKFDGYGNLYVGGAFANLVNAGTVVCNGIAKHNGTSFSAMASGISGTTPIVYAIYTRGSRYVYAGGSNAAGAVFQRYDGSAAAWTDYAATGFTRIYAIARAPKGYYLGGYITHSGSNYQVIQLWNGVTYKTIFSGAIWGAGYEASTVGQVKHITPLKDGSFVIGGSFSTFAGITIPGDVALMRNNATITPIDIDLEVGANTAYDAVETRSGELWLVGSWTTTPIPTGVITSVTSGTVKAYPKIRMTGPGSFWALRNYTTGQEIIFTGLTLQAGETAILDLRPGYVSFTSSWRGNMLETIAPGSDLDFFLMPGSNNVSMYISGSTAATKVGFGYQPQYWSIDGAAR
jgi:hypothetical protein